MSSWAEPTHCPLCGRACIKPDKIDPEVLRCAEHGRIKVEVYV